MADFNFNLTGFDEVSRKLRGLAPKLQKKALRNASRKAMNIVRNQARSNAPVDSGLTKRNIVTQVKSRRSAVTARVGIRGGGRKQGSNPFYWRFIELGFYNVKAKRFIKANPFMRNSLSQNTEKVTDTMAKELKTAIENEI